MHISYSNDTQRGAGHGILTCRDAPFTKGNYSIAIERASDRLFLSGNSEWGAQQTYLPVSTAKAHTEELQLLLGPAIVDQLDTQERYRIHLTSDDGLAAKALLQVADIAYSSFGSLNNAVAVPPPPTDTMLSASPEEPANEPAAEQQPDAMLPDMETLAEEDAHAAEKPAEKSYSAKRFLIPVALVLLLLLCGGAWFFLHTPSQQPPRPEITPDTATENPQPPAQQPPVQQAAASNTQQPSAAQQENIVAPAPTVEERVKLFFHGQEITPEAAARLSRELPAGTPAEQDAIYRLYYFAAEHGEASVLMDYAACLDPTRPQWGSINKDAVAAWDVYEKTKSGRPEAAEAQRALRTWLEQRAHDGDGQAKHWLQQLP